LEERRDFLIDEKKQDKIGFKKSGFCPRILFVNGLTKKTHQKLCKDENWKAFPIKKNIGKACWICRVGAFWYADYNQFNWISIPFPFSCRGDNFKKNIISLPNHKILAFLGMVKVFLRGFKRNQKKTHLRYFSFFNL